MGDRVFLGGDFVGNVSVGEVGFLVEDGGGVLIGEVEGDLGGEVGGKTIGIFGGDGGMDGSSTSIAVGLTLGEPSMTSGSFGVVTSGFSILNKTIFVFLDEEEDFSVASS